MNVFVVLENNGQEYEDEEIENLGVFKTFRGGSQYLIDKGFVPYALHDTFSEKWQLLFQKRGGRDKNFEAWIEEHTLQD